MQALLWRAPQCPTSDLREGTGSASSLAPPPGREGVGRSPPPGRAPGGPAFTSALRGSEGAFGPGESCTPPRHSRSLRGHPGAVQGWGAGVGRGRTVLIPMGRGRSCRGGRTGCAARKRVSEHAGKRRGRGAVLGGSECSDGSRWTHAHHRRSQAGLWDTPPPCTVACSDFTISGRKKTTKPRYYGHAGTQGSQRPGDK